jgi:hypothetical protein
MGLDITGFYVNPFGAPEVCRQEHLVCLPNPRNIPEEDFQFALVLPPFLTLHAGKEDIGIGTVFGSNKHET